MRYPMGNAIVTYFSVAGFTAEAAGKLARAIGAELYEIRPEISGGAAGSDLSGVEFRCLPDVSRFDTIFVGLPIWWYAAPTVINHFLEKLDLRGKTVVPFATSGGGGLDRVRARMAGSCPGARLKEASLIGENMDLTALAQWADQAVL